VTLVSRTVVATPPQLAAAFGGVSGLDYDPERKLWYLISDDRAEHAPARFYTAVARFRRERARMIVRSMTPLTDAKGQPFAAPGQGREYADGESLRINPRTGLIAWSSEGDFPNGFGPAVRWMDRTGLERARAVLPRNLAHDRTGARGPRANRTGEGLAIDAEGALWLSMEAPLVEDGETPTAEHGAMIRVTRLDPGAGPARQYAYPVDAVPQAPPAPRRSDNGVSEILAVDNRRFLVLERSGYETEPDRFAFHDRLYLADFGEATDVVSLTSLKAGGFTPARKTLLFDFDTLPGRRFGNLEAMAWEPGSKQTRLVLATDNNFDPVQPTELLILSVGDLPP